jgi:glyoxylase-like metal-dependent hydrolase (beta-lactamase superfamily II)
MIRLRYGNTNTYYIDGLLVDTDYAGTLKSFYKCLKENGLRVEDIHCVMATHYHPDHMGLVGELTQQGVELLLADVQKPFVHFSDRIFERDKLHFVPVDETKAAVISCEESRTFLSRLGIEGEIVHIPSHSPDSVALVLDNGDCFAGDLEPLEYIEAYGENPALKEDWDRIMSLNVKRVFFAHRPERAV